MPRNILKNLEGERVVVQLGAGRAVRGVITTVGRDCVVLAAAEELAENAQGDAEAHELAGAAVIERERVLYYQRLGAQT